MLRPQRTGGCLAGRHGPLHSPALAAQRHTRLSQHQEPVIRACTHKCAGADDLRESALPRKRPSETPSSVECGQPIQRLAQHGDRMISITGGHRVEIEVESQVGAFLVHEQALGAEVLIGVDDLIGRDGVGDALDRDVPALLDSGSGREHSRRFQRI